VQVQVRDRVAKLVGLAVLVDDLAGPLEVRFVLAEGAAVANLEQLVEGLFLNALDPLGETAYMAT